MNKLALAVAVMMLTVSAATKAAADSSGASTSTEAAVIFEWVDDAGLKHASDTVPERYKSVAKRVDPGRSRIPVAEQAEAERRAAVIKANAASSPPVSRSSAVEAQDGPARTSRIPKSSGPSASECAAMRKRFAESQECFVGFSNPDGTSGFHSCVNEVVPDPEPVCGRN